MCIIIQFTILRVSDKASLQEHGQIAVLVLSMPASLPCAISQDVFNGLTRTIHTQQSVLVTGISKTLMLHDGDRHHWLTVSNLTRNCICLCYIACSCIALMFELKWLVCDRQRVHAYSKFCRRACIHENLGI